MEEIKKFRLLGIAVADIQKLYTGEIEVDEVMKRRLQELEDERRNLELVKNVCKNAVENHININNLDELQIDENNEAWQKRLAVIMVEDTVQEVITQKQFNFHVALMLAWGFGLCAMISFFSQSKMLDMGNKFLDYSKTQDNLSYATGFPWIQVVSAVALVIMTIVVVWSSRMMAQLVAFHVTVVAQSLFLLIFFATKDFWGVVTAQSLGIIWIELAVFALVLYGLFCLRNNFFSNVRYPLIAWGLYVGVSAVILLKLNDFSPVAIVPIVVSAFIGICVTLQWAHCNTDNRSYNRFYAASCSARMVNFIGFIFAGRGYYGGGSVFRR